MLITYVPYPDGLAWHSQLAKQEAGSAPDSRGITGCWDRIRSHEEKRLRIVARSGNGAWVLGELEGPREEDNTGGWRIPGDGVPWG